jgi:hypothetical protein
MQDTSWHEILIEYAERDRAAVPVHPTIHLNSHDYRAAIEAGFRPEDLTEMKSYVDTEAEVAVAGGVSHTEAIAALNGMTKPGQELDMVNAAGQQTIMETFAPRTVPIPAPQAPANDMRPKQVDRAAIKAARKMSRVNRRKRGKR